MRQAESPYTQTITTVANKGEETKTKKIADEKASVTREKLLALSFIIDERIAKDQLRQQRKQ